MNQTNSYKKYFDILEYIDKKVENHNESPSTTSELARVIGLGGKQTLRCMNEIVSVDGRYKLTKVGRESAIIKEN